MQRFKFCRIYTLRLEEIGMEFLQQLRPMLTDFENFLLLVTAMNYLQNKYNISHHL